MALCPHCKRPKLEALHTLEDWNSRNCLRSDEYCKQVAPYEAEIAKRDAQLAQAQAEIAALREQLAECGRAGCPAARAVVACAEGVCGSPICVRCTKPGGFAFDAARAKLKETT